MVNWLLLVKAVVLVSLPSLLLLCALSFNTQQDGKGGSCSPICHACVWPALALLFHVRIGGVHVYVIEYVYFTCLRAISCMTSDRLLLSFVLQYS